MEQEIDFYALLGVEFTATEKEIRKAFRIKSLTCHPDKVDKNDTKAAELFHLINLAVDTLTDPVKKVKYDNIHKAERLRKQRMEEMDANRRFEKEKLFQRERDADISLKRKFSEAEQEKIELNLLRERNQQKMKARQEMKRQEIASSLAVHLKANDMKKSIAEAGVMDCSVKLKFKRELGVDEARIRNSFSRYGEIDTVLVKEKTAVVTFKQLESCFTCVYEKKDWEDLQVFKISCLGGSEPLGFEYIRMLKDGRVADAHVLRGGGLNRGQEYEELTLKKLMEKEKEKQAQSDQIQQS